MALTASYTTRGFEFVRNTMGLPAVAVAYEMTPGITINQGDMVVLTAGKVAKAAAGATNVLGVAAETKTSAAGTKTMIRVYDNPFNVYRCTFADHIDSTATGGSTTTIVDTNGLASFGTNDAFKGGLVYVYDGAGKGSIRTVTAFDGTTKTLTVGEAFPAAINTTSKYVLLGAGGAANDAINIGKAGVDLKDENTIDANATTASEAGPLVVVPTPDEDIKNLILHVMIRKHLFNGI